MYPCVVCGLQQSVVYGSGSRRGFNQRIQKEFGEVVVTRG